ncbi:MAG: hypothetical protein ACM3O6_06805, partial [Acidobacteriota bacterium]
MLRQIGAPRSIALVIPHVSVNGVRVEFVCGETAKRLLHSDVHLYWARHSPAGFEHHSLSQMRENPSSV